jgi:lysophospholipase L1-like esterase
VPFPRNSRGPSASKSRIVMNAKLPGDLLHSMVNDRVGSDASKGPKLVSGRQKLVLVVFGVSVALLVAEVIARATIPGPRDPFAHNPIIKQQSDQVDLFEPDGQLGHKLKGGDFVGVYSAGLVSFGQIVNDPKHYGRLVVLNLGDSSTSGWDSDVIENNAALLANGYPPKSPFQVYKTYSDILAEQSWLYVINAGVPGFSSLQGSRYLRKLLADFARAGVRVDVVTVYFGNNDSIWNGNVEDKYRLPGSGFHLHLFRLIDQASSLFSVVTRVKASEYGDNIDEMVRTCREAGVNVVLLEPIVPRMWPPGLRAHGREDEVETELKKVKGMEVGVLFKRAQEKFAQGQRSLSDGEIDDARDFLEQAKEDDYFVPRIKQGHAEVLRSVATGKHVALVSVRERIPFNDAAFFRDYCHPDEPANRLLGDMLVSDLRMLQPRH